MGATVKTMAFTCYYPNISITRVIMKDTPPHLKRQPVGGVKYLWPNKFNLDSIIFLWFEYPVSSRISFHGGVGERGVEYYYNFYSDDNCFIAV